MGSGDAMEVDILHAELAGADGPVVSTGNTQPTTPAFPRATRPPTASLSEAALLTLLFGLAVTAALVGSRRTPIDLDEIEI